MRNSFLKRSGMPRVNEGSHSFWRPFIKRFALC